MDVQVCNLRASDFDTQFIGSLVNTGFAVITHHGIDAGLIKETQDAWRKFFTSNSSYKSEFVNPTDPNLGYTGLLEEKAVGAEQADLKEFYHWKPGQVLPQEVLIPTQRLFNLLEGDIAGQLLRAINGIGSAMNYREVCQNSDNTVLRALYYPPLESFQGNGGVRSFAHEDINFITLLVAATFPGLQVMDRNGTWYDVPYEENSIIVNVGDMLQLASGGMLKSTTHRVTNPESLTSDRISIPLFIHPNGDTMLTSGYTAQQYLNERLNAIYKKGYAK